MYFSVNPNYNGSKPTFDGTNCPTTVSIILKIRRIVYNIEKHRMRFYVIDNSSDKFNSVEQIIGQQSQQQNYAETFLSTSRPRAKSRQPYFCQVSSHLFEFVELGHCLQ